MVGTPPIVVVADPALGCIPQYVQTFLQEAAIENLLIGVDEFKTFPAEVRNAHAVVIGVNVKFDASCLDLMPELKAIVSAVVGLEAVDLDAAASRSISVANSPANETSESMAEATILLILACLYDLRGNQEILRNNEPRPAKPSGRMLKGRTVGLVGFGRTAQAVATRLRGWDVNIHAYARHAAPPFEGVQFVSLESLMIQSDVVSVHVALNSESVNLLDERLLKTMKPGAVLVNTARGSIIDEIALARLCQSGHISTVGLDVFSTEPLHMDSPLRSLDHAILTPHRLGHTDESLRALAHTAAENILDFTAGRPLRNAIAPKQTL